LKFKKGDIPWNFTDLTGRRFGRLTVIKRDYSDPRNKADKIFWLCKCDCGNEKNIDGRHLRNGNTKSCGCLRNELTSKRSRLGFGLANTRERISRYKSNAKNRGLEWNLTEEQFTKLTKQNCYYCGAKPKNQSKRKWQNGSYACNGLDRIDNTKGYTIDNVVPCCKDCNAAKGKLTLQEFKDLIKRIYIKLYK